MSGSRKQRILPFMSQNQPTHTIALIGGATAGAEAARVFADAGITTVVFEQNIRPYGKVEDGLPRWHVNLRRKEYNAIDSKLDNPRVHFVPSTRIGRDVQLTDLLDKWPFHAVVLANGAWRDRGLPIDGVDAYVDKGLLYQNAFIYWFNHAHEKSYNGPRYEVPDGIAVVGGGLASIDVAKVIQYELVRAELGKRGIEIDAEEFDHLGIPKLLEKHNLTWEQLGLKGCTVYYRRRLEDMPLAEVPDGADETVKAKIEAVRKKIATNAMNNFLFKIEPLHAPSNMIVEGGRLSGLVFDRTHMVDGKPVKTGEVTEVRAPLIISSIGSIPEGMPGIPMKGELYAYSDWDMGRFKEHPKMFSVGNVVTGKGNLVASRKHAHRVAEYIVQWMDSLGQEAKAIADHVLNQPAHSDAAMEDLITRIRHEQHRAGYDGQYKEYIAKVTPPDFV